MCRTNLVVRNWVAGNRAAGHTPAGRNSAGSRRVLGRNLARRRPVEENRRAACRMLVELKPVEVKFKYRLYKIMYVKADQLLLNSEKRVLSV